MKPEEDLSALSWNIKNQTPVIATYGDSEKAREGVIALLRQAGKSFFVLDTPHMVYAADIEEFFRSNGIKETPDVLILHRFNSVNREQTYFIKVLLLDANARGPHAVFTKMKQVIITCDKGGKPLDDGLASCVHSVADL